MKRTKKLFAALLTAVMTLCMGTTAFAAGEKPTDTASVTIKKNYVAANAGTTSPAETFTLAQVGEGRVTDGDAAYAPDLGTITGASFAEGGAAKEGGAQADITVALPQYTSVGVYEYTLKEIAGTTAGVTYHNGNIILKVTVIQTEGGRLRVAAVHTEEADGEKNDTFTNTYSAGTLSVKKEVTGNLGDQDKYFTFKVKLEGEQGKTYAKSYAVAGGSYGGNPKSVKVGEEATFRLKHDDTISIANLPYGVKYIVTEEEADGYTTTKAGDAGDIRSEFATASFTNDKTGSVDTGIHLDSLPYILVLAAVAAAVAVLIVRRRRISD